MLKSTIAPVRRRLCRLMDGAEIAIPIACFLWPLRPAGRCYYLSRIAFLDCLIDSLLRA